MPLAAGTKLGPYEVVALLGAGGMGEVYRARDERLKRDVAIKVLPADSSEKAGSENKLLREAQSASALNDPHICTIYEVGEANGRGFIVMELVEGRPLKALIPPEGLPPTLVIRYGTQIASALAHAHDRGIVHRDVKSSNIVITRSGQVKVLDFGLAKRLENSEIADATRSMQSVTEPGGIVGTLSYMAPEILRGEEADARSDVWALGVVLYEMSAGHVPFRGQTGYQLSSSILREAPASLPRQVPHGLHVVIERCLEKEAGHRYQRASEARAALEAIQPDTSLMISEGASSAALPMRASDSPRRRIAWAAASLMAVIAGVLIALNVGGIRGHFSEPNAMGRIQSIAVLPLENLSRNPEQDYFADGMTEELINALGKVRALRVTSRTSVMRYKGTRKSLRDVAKELGVDALVEGSVLSQADRVRITAQLVDGSNDRQLWGENYERDSRDVLALQDQVASAIADGIRVQLSPQERTILSNARPVDPAAYDAYLRGRREYDDEQKSVLFFQQAIQKQPNYAAAYAGLASSYTYLDYAGTGRTEATFPKARDAAKKALELDDSLGEAHAALGWVDLRFAWNFPEAERELKRAIELNPSDTEAHHFMSHYYAAVGRLPESFDETKVALKLDPLNELLWVHLIWNYRATRQYDLGLAQIPKLLAIAPNSLSAHNMAAKLYEECDRYDEALTEFRKASELDREREPDLILALARISAAKGRKEDALKYLSRLDRVSSVKVTSPYSLAEVYARMGDRDRALSYLEAAFARRDANMSDLNLFPTFDLIREDRRFQDIVRRVGLPK